MNADGWIIDVCRTCGRIATWPFCVHRSLTRDDGKPWCVQVIVRPATAEGRELAALNAAQRTERRA
jgi:hypothetical protein